MAYLDELAKAALMAEKAFECFGLPEPRVYDATTKDGIFDVIDMSHDYVMYYRDNMWRLERWDTEENVLVDMDESCEAIIKSGICAVLAEKVTALDMAAL